MIDFKVILQDIADLNIQGAANVAKAAAKGIGILVEEHKNESKVTLIHLLNKAKMALFQTRPTEPAMRNVLKFILSDIESAEDVVRTVDRRIDKVEEHFKKVEARIAEIGSKKILSGMIVFTHCHSSAVVNILKRAKKDGKRFTVHNTETRPRFQGRLTAKELSIAGIPVVHYVDAAARFALKKADIMLLGADAISSEGKVVNKVGSELFAEIADKYDVPLYICTDSWKFDPESVFGFEQNIEVRPAKEVWPTAPKGIMIDNQAFEKIDADLITGIISELGVYKPGVFVEEIKTAYPWML